MASSETSAASRATTIDESAARHSPSETMQSGSSLPLSTCSRRRSANLRRHSADFPTTPRTRRVRLLVVRERLLEPGGPLVEREAPLRSNLRSGSARRASARIHPSSPRRERSPSFPATLFQLAERLVPLPPIVRRQSEPQGSFPGCSLRRRRASLQTRREGVTKLTVSSPKLTVFRATPTIEVRTEVAARSTRGSGLLRGQRSERDDAALVGHVRRSGRDRHVGRAVARLEGHVVGGSRA